MNSGLTVTIVFYFQELVDINDSLKVIFLAFPNYCLGRGLIDLAKNQFLGIFDRFGKCNKRIYLVSTIENLSARLIGLVR